MRVVHRLFPSVAFAVTAAPLLALLPSLANAYERSATPPVDAVVANCNDSGPGSLRAAVAAAASGDTISLKSTPCSQITLTRPIAVPQANLWLLGRGRAFTIHGNNVGSVLRHTGSGTLRVEGLSIAYGRHAAAVALGGCIYSAGAVIVRNARVHHCTATSLGAGTGDGIYAGGGGIYAVGPVSVRDSAIDGNAARFVPAANSFAGRSNGGGGGVFSGGRLTFLRSHLHHNFSSADAGGARAFNLTLNFSDVTDNRARDIAGLLVNGSEPPVVITNSTIARNRAERRHGAASFGTGTLLIVNSTISWNEAENESGLRVSYYDTQPSSVLNSTIAFNHDRVEGSACEGALQWEDILHMESTIVANNTCGTRPSDIEVDYHFSPVIQGGNNLIGASTVVVPPDTLSVDPRLAPLARNGGPTLTHALLPGSPAIDRGSNVGGLPFDQRGGGYRRVRGAAADIGAFER